jgi:hypothetical protein
VSKFVTIASVLSVSFLPFFSSSEVYEIKVERFGKAYVVQTDSFIQCLQFQTVLTLKDIKIKRGCHVSIPE